MVEQLLEDKRIYNTISTAKLEYGLENEMAFVIVAAHLDGFLIPGNAFTKDLLRVLNYPLDDVAVALRLYDLYHKWDRLRFLKFAKKYGIDTKVIKTAIKTMEHLVKPHAQFGKGIRPNILTIQIDAISNLFVKLYLRNPCIYTGSDEIGFFDYNNEATFEIFHTSRLYYSPGIRHIRPAVYCRLVVQRKKYYAPFLCVVPVPLTTSMKYSKIINGNFSVGPIIACRILAMSNEINKRPSDPGYVSIRKYHYERGVLSALCTNNSYQKINSLIRDEVVAAARELTLTVHRHFYIEHYNVLAILGPGLQIFHLQLTDKDSDSLVFKPENGISITEGEVKELSQVIEKINSRVSFSLYKEKETNKPVFLACFPSSEEAEMTLKRFTTSHFTGYSIQPLNLRRSADFYGHEEKNKWKIDEGILARTLCAICLERPDCNNAIRLSLCGHVFCGTCIIHSMEHADKFPIECIVEHCTGILTFDDIDTVFKRHYFRDEGELNAFLAPIVSNSLEYFLRTKKNRGFKKCMSENCSCILNVPAVLKTHAWECSESVHALNAEQREILHEYSVYCYGCKQHRCGLCGFSFHQDLDCQEYYAKNFVYNDKTLVQWKSGNPENRRFCPNAECHVLMEKIEGCNHIQCIICKTHFCWLCKDFSTIEAKDIYEHMQKTHNSTELNENLFLLNGIGILETDIIA